MIRFVERSSTVYNRREAQKQAASRFVVALASRRLLWRRLAATRAIRNEK
jgi:hypothetical protein